MSSSGDFEPPLLGEDGDDEDAQRLPLSLFDETAAPPTERKRGHTAAQPAIVQRKVYPPLPAFANVCEVLVSPDDEVLRDGMLVRARGQTAVFRCRRVKGLALRYPRESVVCINSVIRRNWATMPGDLLRLDPVDDVWLAPLQQLHVTVVLEPPLPRKGAVAVATHIDLLPELRAVYKERVPLQAGQWLAVRKGEHIVWYTVTLADGGEATTTENSAAGGGGKSLFVLHDSTRLRVDSFVCGSLTLASFASS